VLIGTVCMKRIFYWLTIVALFVALIGSSVVQAQPLFTVQAKSSVLMDFSTGRILFEQEPEVKLLPASLVKIMNLYLAFDALKQGTITLDDKFTVSIKAWQPVGSKMFLKEGDQVTVDDLLKGIAVVSGNDACISMAEGIAGVTEVFVQMMNDKATKLGLVNTHFTDVHGLDDSSEQYTTALDIASLARSYILNHPNALEYHSTKEFTYNNITQRNRNGLLWTYSGVDGLKTGHLSKVGYNLVATAKQNDMRLIAVVLGADSEASRENEVRKLLNYGFRNFETIKANDIVTPINTEVYKAKVKRINVVPAENVPMLIPVGAKDQVRVVKDIQKPLVAPLKKGQAIGEFKFFWQDELLASTKATVDEDVPKGGFFKVLWDSIRLFFAKIFSSKSNV